MLNIPDCHSNTFVNFWGRAKGLWRLLSAHIHTLIFQLYGKVKKLMKHSNPLLVYICVKIQMGDIRIQRSIRESLPLVQPPCISFSTQNLSWIQSERLSNHISCLLPSVVKLHSFTIRRQQGHHPRIRDSTQHNCWGGGLKRIMQLTRSIRFCLTRMSSSWWSSSTSGVKLNKGHECPHCQKHEIHDKKGHLLRKVKS